MVSALTTPPTLAAAGDDDDAALVLDQSARTMLSEHPSGTSFRGQETKALSLVSKGSLRAMVERLTVPAEQPADFDAAGWEIMLLTTTASNTDLLDLLTRRYIIPIGVGGVSSSGAAAASAVRQLVVIALLHWIQLNFLSDLRLSLDAGPDTGSLGPADDIKDACFRMRVFLDKVVGRTNRAAATLLADTLHSQLILCAAAGGY